MKNEGEKLFCALCATFSSVQVLQRPQSHTVSSATATGLLQRSTTSCICSCIVSRLQTKFQLGSNPSVSWNLPVGPISLSLSLSLSTLLSQVRACMVWNHTSCPGHRLHCCWPARQSMSVSRQQLLGSVLKLTRISSKLAAYPSSAEFSFNLRCLSISSILFRHSFKSFSSFSICKTSVAQQLVHVYTHIVPSCLRHVKWWWYNSQFRSSLQSPQLSSIIVSNVEATKKIKARNWFYWLQYPPILTTYPPHRT